MEEIQPYPSPQIVAWQALLEPGLEHLYLRHEQDHVVADGLVIGIDEGRIFRLQYTISLDLAYQFQHVQLTMAAPDSPPLTLKRNADGRWTDGAENALPELAACFDIDITATPFTNTLPIRRHELHPGESIDIEVAYISIPDLRVTAEPQRYTCLAKTADESLYRFESLTSGFAADIRVDVGGLVVDYPELFRRVWPMQ